MPTCIYIITSILGTQNGSNQHLLKIQELKLSIIEYFKQQLFTYMLPDLSQITPVFAPQEAQLLKHPNISTYQKPLSAHKIRAEELLALKKRVKQRHQNKQNNPMFKSDNWGTPISAGLQNTFTHGYEQNPNEEPFKLDMNDFEMGDLLGKGAQAKVRMVIHKPTKSIYSIKTIGRQKVGKKLDSFIRSLKIQMCLDHPNIAKIYGIVVQQTHVHIIMQYCADGDLSMNVRTLKESKSVKDILFHMAQGLEYLHALRVHHRDIKLENILLSYGVPKITDFELSVYTKLDFFPRKTICGSPAYFCPEMIQKQRYNKKADIWSLGIVFYELLCGYFPFDVEVYSDIQNIHHQNMKEFPISISKEGANLISQMLCKDSEERITIEDVLSHSYFKVQAKDRQEMRK